MGFRMFPVWIKAVFGVLWVSLLVLFGTVYFTIVSDRILKILFPNVERGTDLSRFLLVTICNTMKRHVLRKIEQYMQFSVHKVLASFRLRRVASKMQKKSTFRKTLFLILIETCR